MTIEIFMETAYITLHTHVSWLNVG